MSTLVQAFQDLRALSSQEVAFGGLQQIAMTAGYVPWQSPYEEHKWPQQGSLLAAGTRSWDPFVTLRSEADIEANRIALPSLLGGRARHGGL